jgi:hypothetical protein
LSRGEFRRRAGEFLKRIQEELPRDKSKDVVAINMETGEYVLAKTNAEATEAFWSRWPDVLMYVCRVDGGPTIKFHGM